MFEAKEYISWRLKAHGKAGVQAPFLFRLCNEVLSTKNVVRVSSPFEKIRQSLLSDKREVTVTDMGAGAKTESSNIRSVSYIARTSAKQKKWAEALHRLAQDFQPNTIIELGTSFGISGMYLASAIPSGKLVTLEGCPNIAEIARENFQKANITNIDIRVGNFDETLPKLLESVDRVDFVYIDGNHTEEATLRYFSWLKDKAAKNTVLIFDDIHWSEGMKNAWQQIINDKSVTLTVDLFQIGLVFFNPGLSKQHFNLTI
jgi:predicted O-methyltransferase YrrM